MPVIEKLTAAKQAKAARAKAAYRRMVAKESRGESCPMEEAELTLENASKSLEDFTRDVELFKERDRLRELAATEAEATEERRRVETEIEAATREFHLHRMAYADRHAALQTELLAAMTAYGVASDAKNRLLRMAEQDETSREALEELNQQQRSIAMSQARLKEQLRRCEAKVATDKRNVREASEPYAQERRANELARAEADLAKWRAVEARLGEQVQSLAAKAAEIRRRAVEEQEVLEEHDAPE